LRYKKARCTTYKLWASNVIVFLASSAYLNCYSSSKLSYPEGEVSMFQHVMGFCMRAQTVTEKWC